MDQLNRLLDEVARRDGIAGLKLAHDGTAGLQLRCGMRIFFEYIRASGKLYVFTPLMELPDAGVHRYAMYDLLLHLNFLQLGCGNGMLAVSQRTDEVIYQLGLDATNLPADCLDRAIDEVIKQQPEMLYQLIRAADADSTRQTRVLRPSTVNLLGTMSGPGNKYTNQQDRTR